MIFLQSFYLHHSFFRLKTNENWNKFYNNQTELIQNFYNFEKDEYLEFSEFLKILFTDDVFTTELRMHCAYDVHPNEVISQSNTYTFVQAKLPSKYKWNVSYM